MSTFKSGRWSNEDVLKVKEFIEEGLSYEQISTRVNRPPDTIKSLVENKLLMNLSEDAENSKKAEIDIKKSSEWTEIEKQLSKDEQDTFLHHWREILAQFKNDVTHTEKLQITDIIRNEILLNRVMIKIHNANNDIGKLNKEFDDEMLLDTTMRDTSKIVDTQQRMTAIGSAIGAYNREYKELMERKQNILRDIKGTREQRIKRIEDSKETITGWIAALIASPEIRQKLGIQMEKIRIAQIVEYERLSDYHTYHDGQMEQPILNSETLKDDNY